MNKSRLMTLVAKNLKVFQVGLTYYQDLAPLPAGLTADTSTLLSLAPISLTDSEENTGPVMSHLSHMLRHKITTTTNDHSFSQACRYHLVTYLYNILVGTGTYLPRY